MKFADIPGLHDIKEKLITSVRDGKVPHAMLFHGKAGALNLPLAIAFAAYLHCEDKKNGDACGACAACTLSKKHIHPDTHFAYPVGNMKTELKEKDDEKLRNELLKHWRQFLTDQPFGSADGWINQYGGEDKQPIISREDGREIIRSLALKPFQSRVKVMIIWQPELMHSSAANGILKILEEPPPQTFFLLVTNQIGQLLPTILSRTQIVTIPLTDDDDIRAELSRLGYTDAARVEKAVAYAEGDLQQAILMMDETDSGLSVTFQEWMRACFRFDPVTLLQQSEQYHAADRLYQRNLLHHGLHILRETLLSLTGAAALQRTTGVELEFVRKFSTVMNTSRVDRAASLFSSALYELERNGSAKMIFMDLSVKVNQVIRDQA